VALAPGFEWFVAWRHLRDPARGRSRTPLVVGLAILVLGAALLAAATWLDGGGRLGVFGGRPTVFGGNLRMTAVGVIAAGSLFTIFGFFYALFTLFTAISVVGVFLGTAFPIVALSVMSGFETDLKTKIRGAKADVVITRADDEPFTDHRAVAERLRDVPGVVASTPYIESEVMIRQGANPAGVILRGIDPATATSVLDLSRSLREGRVDDLDHPERVRDPWTVPPPPAERALGSAPKSPPKSPPTQVAADAGERPSAPAATSPPVIFLGEELYARNLRVFMGSDLEVVCPLCGLGPTGLTVKPRTFRVGGHFYSGMYEFDSKLAYISLAEAQRLFDMPGEVTGLDLRVATPEQADAVARQIAARLGPSYEVRSWEDLNRGLFMALRLEKIAMFIVLAFIALVASFSIVSNLIMLVTEKGKEIAILKAMGAGNGGILRVFIAEGMYIGLLGLGLGLAVGIALCVLIKTYGLPLPTDVYYINKLPVVMKAGEIGTVAALALLLCCLATLYPALEASRLRPVEGLRYE
jgi:lipoprotein-releasing system permease protein